MDIKYNQTELDKLSFLDLIELKKIIQNMDLMSLPYFSKDYHELVHSEIKKRMVNVFPEFESFEREMNLSI